MADSRKLLYELYVSTLIRNLYSNRRSEPLPQKQCLGVMYELIRAAFENRGINYIPADTNLAQFHIALLIKRITSEYVQNEFPRSYKKSKTVDAAHAAFPRRYNAYYLKHNIECHFVNPEISVRDPIFDRENYTKEMETRISTALNIITSCPERGILDEQSPEELKKQRELFESSKRKQRAKQSSYMRSSRAKKSKAIAASGIAATTPGVNETRPSKMPKTHHLPDSANLCLPPQVTSPFEEVNGQLTLGDIETLEHVLGDVTSSPSVKINGQLTLGDIESLEHVPVNEIIFDNWELSEDSFSIASASPVTDFCL